MAEKDIEMGQINLGLEEQKRETDPIMDEIENLFEKLKESDILQSNMVEHNELVCSNLVMAYYFAKLERRLGNE